MPDSGAVVLYKYIPLYCGFVGSCIIVSYYIVLVAISIVLLSSYLSRADLNDN